MHICPGKVYAVFLKFFLKNVNNDNVAFHEWKPIVTISHYLIDALRSTNFHS